MFLRHSSVPLTQSSSTSTNSTTSPVISSSTQLGINSGTHSLTNQTPLVLTVYTTSTVSASPIETSALKTRTSTLLTKPTNLSHLQATISFCEQATCEGSCSNQNVTGNGECHQIGHKGAANTRSLDSNCSGKSDRLCDSLQSKFLKTSQLLANLCPPDSHCLHRLKLLQQCDYRWIG